MVAEGERTNCIMRSRDSRRYVSKEGTTGGTVKPVLKVLRRGVTEAD